MTPEREILIRVYGRPNETSPYPVDATLDDDSYFSGGVLEIPDEELLKLDLDLQPYGSRLGQCLFTVPILRALEKAYTSVSSKSASQMRLRLCIDPDAADLQAYPWERLFMQWQGSAIPLAASSLIPFSRFIPLEEGQQDPIEDRPIRLLLAVSSPIRLPAGLEHIAVEDQLRSLTSAIATVPDLAVTVLPGHTILSDEYRNELATLGFTVLPGSTTLERLIEAAGQHHIVHLLSHGAFDGKTAALFLESEDGDFEKAIDTDITAGIASLSAKPKLIYLSACDSANQTGAQAKLSRPMVGLAPKLVQAGVPAVIAMQTRVEIETARKLAASFYAKVLESGEVDRALSEARFEIYGPKNTEWWIPVLFLRLKNGRLFATDPVREAIQATLQKFPHREDRFYLPLEAISLKSKELIRDWERTTSGQKAGADLWQMTQAFEPGLTVLAGNAGTGKSTILQRLARASAEAIERPCRILPLWIDMREYTHVRVSGLGRLRNLIYETFRGMAPSLSETRFDRLLSGSGGVLFRLLFDNLDLMPDNARRPALYEIEQFADESPHQLLLAMDCRLFEPSDAIDELLVIQPLSARKVAKFLSAKGGVPSDESLRLALLAAIDDAELFELAAMPWLLLHMLEQVKRVLPRSRVMVLEDWVDNALYSAAVDGGRGMRAKDSLYAIGWKMHSERRLSLTIEEAFAMLRVVRSQREYNLEKLLDQLVESGMLVRVGDELIRFAYPPLQGYCAARAILTDPRRADVIEDIVATLGQSSRVVWWGRVISLLAGMMPDPAAVLQPIVNGASLTQGEQVFVAADCLIEYARRESQPGAGSAPDATSALVESFRQQVRMALLWRTKRVNEFRFRYRERAVEALGLFRREESIPTFISLAVDRVRLEEHGSLEFEYSQVRFAAIRALLRVRYQVTSDRLAGHPHAADLIAAWIKADVPALTALLKDTDEGVQGGAAFALGDLQTPETAAALYSAFRDSTTSFSTLWAVADAIQELEPLEVWTALIQPCIAQAGSTLPETPLYERLLFLIGELRIHDESARNFASRYLSEPATAALKGRALVALGKLHAAEQAGVQDWEAAIHGKFEGICAVGDPNAMFLRRKAIEAVGKLGDLDLLYRARQTGEWEPELDEPFFRAAEECLTLRSTISSRGT